MFGFFLWDHPINFWSFTNSEKIFPLLFFFRYNLQKLILIGCVDDMKQQLSRFGNLLCYQYDNKIYKKILLCLIIPCSWISFFWLSTRFCLHINS